MTLRPLRQLGPRIRSPLGIVDPAFDPRQETGMGPVARGGHKAVMHRVDVNVINMPGKIYLVSNGMLPEPPLPDPLLTFESPAFVAIGCFMSFEISSRECLLDQTPSS